MSFEARRLNIPIAFSKLGTIDEYLLVPLERVSRNLSQEDANKARVKYIVDDILNMAMYGFDFIDAYVVWLVIVSDVSYKKYLRHDNIVLPPISIMKVDPKKIGEDKVQYPAYGSLIMGYASLAEQGKYQIVNYLHHHFKNSPIKVLNLETVYPEILRLAQGTR